MTPESAPPDFGFRFRLPAEIVEAHIAIEPSRQRGAREKNQRDRKQLHGAEQAAGAHGFRSGPPPENRARKHQHSADHEPRIHGQLDQPANQMQSEQNDDRAGDRPHQRLVLQQKLSHGARRRAKTDEDHGESRDKCQRRSEQAVARRLAVRNCSTPMPESMETYPGTSGSTHGDRKEMIPATKA